MTRGHSTLGWNDPGVILRGGGGGGGGSFYPMTTVHILPGVHNAKAEECTTPHIGSRNIEINIGGGGLPRNQK